jgi:hypothetical protein
MRRVTAERQVRPRDIREAAKRSQVLPRYMAMGYWAPGGKRNKVFKGNR